MTQDPSVANLAKNEAGQKVIRIEFDHRSLDLLNKIQSLPGRKYHPDIYCWSIPIFAESVSSLQKWKFIVDNKILAFLESEKAKRESFLNTKIENLKGELFPFQKTGVAFIEEKSGRVLIADQMGTGKTIQTIAWLQMHPEKRPVIIVVPASLKLNWQKEV